MGEQYKFAGGGIECGESHEHTLIREVKEETGLTVKPETIREFGSVLRVQRSLCNDDTIFEQENFYYFCETENEISEQNLDEYENDEHFVLEYIEPEKAIDVNRNHKHFGYDQALIEREARVLEKLIN